MTLSERDRHLIWHPYTQMKNARMPIAVVRASGASLFDEKGKEILDAISSWWVNIHGHCHPYIASRIAEQLNRLDQVIFADFTHSGAVDLGERLLQILPGNQKRIFYSDDGSTAVEVAVKMAIQYWRNRGERRETIVAFRHSYHGDTFGAMAVSHRGLFTEAFADFLFDVVFIEPPVPGRMKDSADELRKILDQSDVAALIYEPLVQGAGGMLMHKAEALQSLLSLCREHQVLTIADEVMTGFGRTGKLFASGYCSSSPDLVCLSKGITGGVIALGTTTCSEAVYDAFLSADRSRTFFHGHSYTANPVACAAALASLDLLLSTECERQRQGIERRHHEFAKELAQRTDVENIRMQGTILAFDVFSEEQSSYTHSLRDVLYTFCIREGVLLRPLGNVIYIMPPYCISNDELSRVYEVIIAMLDSLHQ